MPSGLVKTERDEELWAKATAAAEKQGKGKNYAYINGIYQKMKGNTKTASLLHAISSLETTKDMHSTNAPIHAAEGDAKQAELCEDVARSCNDGLKLLRAIEKNAGFLGIGEKKIYSTRPITESEAAAILGEMSESGNFIGNLLKKDPVSRVTGAKAQKEQIEQIRTMLKPYRSDEGGLKYQSPNMSLTKMIMDSINDSGGLQVEKQASVPWKFVLPAVGVGTLGGALLANPVDRYMATFGPGFMKSLARHKLKNQIKGDITALEKQSNTSRILDGIPKVSGRIGWFLGGLGTGAIGIPWFLNKYKARKQRTIQKLTEGDPEYLPPQRLLQNPYLTRGDRVPQPALDALTGRS